MAKENAIEEKTNSRRKAMNTGLWVLLMLAILTFGEYLVGVIATPWTRILLVVAGYKAFWVIKDYMHVGRIFSTEEESH
ncbi:MAG: hypothetical protein O3B43_05150 [Chloroflexi bacterium]|nr:hypothetical protein [Chloroflexota bacterium]